MEEEKKKETKECPKCHTDIPAKASKCPNCQSDLRSWFRRHPIFTVISVILLVIIFASASGGGNNQTNDKSTEESNIQTESNKPSAPEILSVDLSSFVGEFDKNQLAAEEKYKDKLIKTSGYVDNISEDIVGSYFIILQPTSEEYYMGTSLQCYFENKSDLTSIENGQRLTITGKVDTQVMNVLVKDCSIVE